MKISLNENIRTFRKERRLTQEHLAEALNVTVGAVSKWESGSSVPDISLIVEMADFFETSVDVLLGYDWRSGGMGEAVERIRSLRNAKKFDEASMEAEKSLKKYPNSFEIVFQSAIMYSMKGIEQDSTKALNRSLTLLNRSLELIGQNTNPQINEWTIRNNIARVYLCLGQTDKGLEILKQNNADGRNDVQIGVILVMDKKQPDEALPYLSRALVTSLNDITRTLGGISEAYEQKMDFEQAHDALVIVKDLVCRLKKKGTTSYLDKMQVQLLTGGAMLCIAMGEKADARNYLIEARDTAKAFDANPNNGFENMKFYCAKQALTGFDDFGDTATEGIKLALEKDEETAQETLRIWNEITEE